MDCPLESSLQVDPPPEKVPENVRRVAAQQPLVRRPLVEDSSLDSLHSPDAKPTPELCYEVHVLRRAAVLGQALDQQAAVSVAVEEGQDLHIGLVYQPQGGGDYMMVASPAFRDVMIVRSKCCLVRKGVMI